MRAMMMMMMMMMMMLQGSLSVWTFLLGAGLTLAPAASQLIPHPPQLSRCVFISRANITCHWEGGDPATTNYTLQIQKKNYKGSTLTRLTCVTSNSSCTVEIGRSCVRFTFCIVVTAHGHGKDISSVPRCQSGRVEVRLPPATLNSVKPVQGNPRCLTINWSRSLVTFPVADHEVKEGDLNSQIEFKEQGQFNEQIRNWTVKDYSFDICLFRPDTSYVFRLRHRFQGPQSPWSLWSNPGRGRTAEAAPSAAPEFWRLIKESDKTGLRLISLLWKLLPHSLANGRVLLYNVTCQSESSQVLEDLGSCRELLHPCTSCSLLLPAEQSSCVLTASNSAGTSAEAQIWLPKVSDTEPPPPAQITASPVDKNTLDVRWRSPLNQSVSGFVVEWFVVREKNRSSLQWQRLNSSSTALIITEGIKPMERYAVSVKALYGERGAGQNKTLLVYTRQGAPSAGPVVAVQKLSGNTVELSWSPVPLELLHGFISNYTICYTSANQPTKRVFVPAHLHRYSLENLSPSTYDIYMQANTDAGAGAAGRVINVYIGSEEISVVMVIVLPLALTSLVLVLMVCLSQNERLKRELCQDVPDPSNSSLACWIPKPVLENVEQHAVVEKLDVKHPEIILLGKQEPRNSDHNASYQSSSHIQTFCSHPYSLLPLEGARTTQNTPKWDRKYVRSSAKAKITPAADFSSCPTIYSVLVSKTPLTLPATLLSNELPSSSLGSDMLPAPHSPPLPQIDVLKRCDYFLQERQSPVSSDFCSISYSPHPVQVSSAFQPVCRNHFNSVLSPQLDSHPDPSISPLLQSVFGDPSHVPVECNPYIPF